ncbi:hypothetical protein ACIO3R_07205 [Streptomyces sp. NPDC087428]|uniref:hypothetical protein n=1 Tax=Streptomyces sp. NPDC087428 TaxID=3365788 RepID=UPI0038107CFE
MVEHLPPDGALARAASRSPWTSTDYLLANLADQQARMATDFRNANRSEKTAAEPYPEPVWRPGDPSPKQRAKAEAKAAREAREGYRRIVAQMTPQYADQA